MITAYHKLFPHSRHLLYGTTDPVSVKIQRKHDIHKKRTSSKCSIKGSYNLPIVISFKLIMFFLQPIETSVNQCVTEPKF